MKKKWQTSERKMQICEIKWQTSEEKVTKSKKLV